MKLNFKHIKIIGFLSIGEAELSLDNDGYVLISGINNNPLDNALSNGSGKSSILNAICWTLTGETINGLTTNIPNIHTDTGCMCELDFDVDGTKYKLIRYREYTNVGNDLKIYINGEDKSGKGIRESQGLLEQYLPDLTSDFIGSVILLGQGLPHKFTDNEPSKRKELLEKLSKSDYMINDIRDRLTIRLNQLSSELRNCEDKILTKSSQQDIYNKQLLKAEEALKELNSHCDFDSSLEDLNKQLSSVDKELEETMNNSSDIEVRLTSASTKFLSISEKKQNEISAETTEYEKARNKITEIINNISIKEGMLDSEITKLKAITDICPTCGQKIPGAVKPDTKDKEKELYALKEELSNKKTKLDEFTKTHKDVIDEINREFSSQLSEITNEINRIKSEKEKIISVINKLNSIKTSVSSEINKVIIQRDTHLNSICKVEKEINELTQTLKDNLLTINNLIQDKESINLHLCSVKKMDSVVKRDFRGFLLTNVIKFIDLKAKEYCELVFNTNNIKVELSGNNINIIYCDKAYENLSGGEKQKIDIIIQFAIRDMLCQYLEFSSNIIALDEIFDNLDELGTQEILDLISTKLTDIKTIYIISHHGAQLQIPYDYEITIQKDEKGISSLK